ncbi:MAG: hypothetical protein PHR51_00880 [Patescibacteria group bacterium]|nr:hypothetical protein [Patescibacteria group bacterium]
MKNKIQKFLQARAEMSRQLLVLETVLFATVIMAVATIQIVNADTTADTNLAQNVTAGSLSITGPSQLNFNDGSIGETTIANITTSDPVRIADTRGNLDGWEVTGFFNTNWLKTGDSNVQMDIGTADLYWYPGNMTVQNNTGNNDGVNKGSNAPFQGITNALTLATSNNSHADNGAGSFNLFNIEFKYSIPIGAEATDYTTDMRLTIA